MFVIAGRACVTNRNDMKKLLGMTALAAFALTAQGNMLQNGDFEDLWIGNYDANPGQPGFGWDILPVNINICDSYWGQAASGNLWIDLNGSGQGGISQTVATVPGDTYYLSFASGGNPSYSEWGYGLVKTMDVLIDGTVLAPITFYQQGYGPNNMGWGYYQFPVVASGATTTIEFISTFGGPSGAVGPAVDDVVFDVTARDLATLPAPHGPPNTPDVPDGGSTLIMAGFALAAVVGAKSRRK